MDIAICKIDNSHKKLSFAGARSDLYYVREGIINEIKGDRHTIGENLNDDIRDFQQKEIDFQCNDIYYLSSDGFADQFGESSNKKYMKKKFKELLKSVHTQTLDQQGQLLEQELEQWQGKLEQTDDILVMGVKLT